MAVMAPSQVTREYKQNAAATALAKYLAYHYLLMLKAQNYHWNIVGQQFPVFHLLFEGLYLKLFEDVDLIAERIRAMGYVAPATFSQFNQLCSLKEGNAHHTAVDMLQELIQDYEELIRFGRKDVIEALHKEDDEAGLSLITEHLVAHEKELWMFKSTAVRV